MKLSPGLSTFLASLVIAFAGSEWDQDSRLKAEELFRQSLSPTPRLLSNFVEPATPIFHNTAATAGTVREKLRVELGKGFELTATQRHFVVAFPTGQKDFWSPRFEEIYNAFNLYFSVRGIKLREPSELLTVIVFPSQRDFLRYSAADGAGANSGVLGYYSPKTNRVAMYDTGNAEAGDGWVKNGDVLIHELAHQIAFNTGVHNPNVVNPRWLCEGLGTLFEARGVWRSRTYASQKDRLNAGRFNNYKQFAAADDQGTIARIVESDTLFNSDAPRAYAYAWALTFYLTETQPRKYSDYLQLIAKRPAGAAYSKGERLRDFTTIFGQDMKMIETRFARYLKDVKG